MNPKKTRPKTPAEWSAFRCQLDCEIGRDTLAGKTPPPSGHSTVEYALFNLLHAVEELSCQIEKS